MTKVGLLSHWRTLVKILMEKEFQLQLVIANLDLTRISEHLGLLIMLTDIYLMKISY